MRASAKKRPPRRTQKERRETTRRLLIDAAVDRICALGFGGATLELITERAGVTRGAVQHHFRNRDALLLAVVGELNDQLKALFETSQFADKPLQERLSAICEQLWGIVSSRRFVAAVQIQLGTVTDPNVSPRVLKIMIEIERELDNQWVELFARDGIGVDRVIVARHLAQAALRGLAIKRIYHKRRDSANEERALLVQMLQQALGGSQSAKPDGARLTSHPNAR
jgi:AcrR family transcriptional regulator